jgi:renalase
MQSDVVVIGAGVAGLSCARELHAAGAQVTVLERARGVGGRCATRRVEGQPVDFGAVFLHGSDAEFLRAVEAVEGGTVLKGWPVVRAGAGTPCQPDAFKPTEYRVAFAEGVSVFPKWMARGLEVRLNTRVTAVAAEQGNVRLTLADGAELQTAAVVLALPAEDIVGLIAPLRDKSEELLAASRLLEMISTFPSATVLAGYRLETPEPEWHINYPEHSGAIQLVSHDSSKRIAPRFRVFVYQALPGWSRKHLPLPAKQWTGELLEEAGRVIGAWAASPAWVQTHAWQRARVDRGNELSSPILVELGDGVRLGLAGEVFAPGGGVEAAWMSGRNLGRRMAGGSR